MRRLTLCVVSLTLLGLTASSSEAHHPARNRQPTAARFDPLPPLGNRLPPSYRRVYNRPTYLGGKLAYLIAPSSQEAMSWHTNAHRGAYRNQAGRIEPMYHYAKPWEALPIGPRKAAEATRADGPQR